MLEEQKPIEEQKKKLCPFQGGIFAVPNRIAPHAAQVTFISGPCLGGKCMFGDDNFHGCKLVRVEILQNLGEEGDDVIII